MKLCKDFARGNCRYGDRCRYVHTNQQQQGSFVEQRLGRFQNGDQRISGVVKWSDTDHSFYIRSNGEDTIRVDQSQVLHDEPLDVDKQVTYRVGVSYQGLYARRVKMIGRRGPKTYRVGMSHQGPYARRVKMITGCGRKGLPTPPKTGCQQALRLPTPNGRLNMDDVLISAGRR